MINNHTVFVIGAGAHCPYGFPDGRSLIDKITRLLPTEDDRKNDFRSLFSEAYVHAIPNIGHALSSFRSLLDGSSHTSIDSFLATHSKKPGFPEIGKFAVARVLLPLEFKHDFSRTKRYNNKQDQDWLSYLLEQMCSRCHTPEDFIAKNKVSFVTFNYDRTVEHFLCLRIAKTYGISMSKAWECAQKIPVIHVYGSLGDFKSDLPDISQLRKDGPYLEEIKAAAESIRLMYEDRDQRSKIDEAKNSLAGGSHVCFLGFAFDPDNIARLELSTLGTRKRVYASRYNVPDGEWQQIDNRMRPTNINSRESNRNWDALTFLRESNALV